MGNFVAPALETFLSIDQIPGALLTERVKKMKDVVQTLNDAGLRKTRLYPNLAASLKTTKGEPQCIRRAKALVYHLEHVETPVYEAEQLIGSVTGMWPVDEERNRTLTYEQLTKETIAMLDQYFAQRETVDKHDMGFGYKEGLSFEESATTTPTSTSRICSS